MTLPFFYIIFLGSSSPAPSDWADKLGWWPITQWDFKHATSVISHHCHFWLFPSESWERTGRKHRPEPCHKPDLYFSSSTLGSAVRSPSWTYHPISLANCCQLLVSRCVFSLLLSDYVADRQKRQVMKEVVCLLCLWIQHAIAALALRPRLVTSCFSHPLCLDTGLLLKHLLLFHLFCT